MKINLPVIKRHRIILLAALVLFMYNGFSQTHIKGKIINIKDGKPVPFASIGISKKKISIFADATGNFMLDMNGLKNSDSLYISSIGFNSLRLQVLEALDKNEFALHEQPKDLQPVYLESFTNKATVGSTSDVTGYFRSWDPNKPGGEIGKVFYVGHDEYQLERVRFKVNNQCDTCRIRLRIRQYNNGLPGEEIIRDSISTVVKKLSFDDRFSEFDLRPYNLVLKHKFIFISMEVLGCSRPKGTTCSFCFIGTEMGNYIYKNRRQDEWIKNENDYTIYMKLSYGY